jgi:branched-chain amino acid transport system ATP-binding protein
MVGTLPTGTARLVELARALALNPRALLLDEPSSGLNEHETLAMADLLRRLVVDGLAVLLVEHDMSLVMGVCETIYVLEFGQMIAVGSPGEIQASKAVQAAYLGSAVVGA